MPTKESTSARGYGIKHQAERERWRPKVEAGGVDCARCQDPIEPGRPWDLGHDDSRANWTGPEHRHCNRKAGGRNGAKVTHSLRTKGIRTSRVW